MASYKSYDRAIDDAKRRGRASETRGHRTREQFEGAIASFRPGEYMQQAAGSAYQTLTEDFSERQDGANATMARRGFLGANMGGRRRSMDFSKALSDAMARLSMQTAQLEQNRIGMVGGLHEMDRADSERFYDAEVGIRMSRDQQRAADRASKKALWGAGISAVGNIAGSLIPG